MATIRPQKRSVSPFGTVPTKEEDPLVALREAISKSFPEALHVVDLIQKVTAAPANDAPQLEGLIQFLLKYRESLSEVGLEELVFKAMMDLFERKTELFMISHSEERDTVLFSRERDALVGRFFAPFTERQPGLFSEFVSRWTETENPDRVLHFLDFCAGSKNPTFEYYLLFTHPALARILSNKGQLRGLLERTKPLLAKLSSPTWERDIRAALSL